MHFGGDPLVIMLLVFGMFMIMRRGGFGWQQRRMRQEIAELRERQQEVIPQRGPTFDQVQMLEDRVRVLERIVTDHNYSLARDIEALRDPRDARETEERI